MTKITKHKTILKNMEELKTMFFPLVEKEREGSNDTAKSLLDGIHFNYGYTLFRYRKFIAIKESKLLEKTVPEKMDILHQIFEGEYNFGMEDEEYDYWLNNLYDYFQEERIDFKDYERTYQRDSFNEDKFNEFYTKIMCS